MKNFKEFILVFFSLIVLAISVIFMLDILNIIKFIDIISHVDNYIQMNAVIVMSISAILSILAVVGIFGNSNSGENLGAGLAIKHDSGTVYITKDTFESIVANVTKSYASLKNVKVSVNITQEGAVVTIYAYILPDTVVPTLTTKLQENIKDSVLKQTTVEIKEANIKIKGVYTQVEKKA